MSALCKTALVMIARDEARCIAGSLRSLRPWVDQMIVLDTGSRDGTPAIARAEGAEVHAFTWVDDFAAARNAALDLSDADWNIVVDADELLSLGGEALAALRHEAPTFVGRIEVCSHYREQGAGGAGAGAGGAQHSASSRLARVLPRGVRYTGRIHEQPLSDLPRRDLPISFSHDGYLPAQMATKGERNRRLLEQAVQAAPGDAYLHYQLGKDHEVHDRLEAALEAYEQASQLLGPQPGRGPAWRHDLVLRSLFVLKATGRLAQAVQRAEAEMPLWPDSADFYFVLGDVLLDFAAAHPEQAPELVPMIRGAWENCLQIGDNPSLEGTVHGRGSHLAQANLALLADLLPESGRG